MKFIYIGQNILGERVEDFIEAENKEKVLEILSQKNIKINSLFLAKNKDLEIANLIKKFFEKISQKDIVNFSRQMSALLEAGVPILRGFQLVTEDIQKPFLKEVFETIINDIKSGNTISEALKKHPKAFDDFYVNMIKSGEEGGKIAQAFSYLADHLDRSYALSIKVRNAMIYPSFVVSTFLIVMILVFTTVIPKLAVILKEANVELPLLTRIVLGISDFFVNYGIYLVVIIFGGGSYFWYKFKDTEVFTEYIDKLKLKIPFVKNVFKMVYVTRIAENLQTLISSGVSLPKSIKITSEVVDNVYYKDLLNHSLEQIKTGTPFSESMSGSKELIPNTMIQMLKIGEETGETAKLLANISKFYQREINTTIDTLIGLIEPMMIVALGLGVGVLLVSVLMPIYNLAGAF